jgi:ABC-type multidrug transport system fused ATPase/permease subunit
MGSTAARWWMRGLTDRFLVRRYLCRPHVRWTFKGSPTRRKLLDHSESIPAPRPYLRFSVTVIALFLIARLPVRHTLVAAAALAGLPNMPYQRGQFWIRRFQCRHDSAAVCGGLLLAVSSGKRTMKTSDLSPAAVTLFIGNLFEFLALKPKVLNAALPQPVPPVRETIRFRSVSFSYPETDRLALDGLDLSIPAGRITAVVGSNGAGKSTLIKLLCRFYDPDLGSVELDGVDLRSLDLKTLRSSIIVLFQQPVHYNTSVAENIALRHLALNPDRDAIRTAAESSGAEGIIAKPPAGYDQVLSRGFEHGTELSAGEWQRIALARAFLRRAPILVLDEPTSAMDPWAEADWLSRFRRLAASQTALVITHRFTTARIADVIYVIAGGRVIECGSHEELLAAGGRYAQGWAAQTGAASSATRFRHGSVPRRGRRRRREIPPVGSRRLFTCTVGLQRQTSVHQCR